MADRTESSITIAAEAAVIMDVIADLEQYPEWTSGVLEVEVLTVFEDTGRPAEARFVIDQSGIKDDYGLEYEWDGDISVSWTLGRAGSLMKAMDGTYLLNELGEGLTEVVYQLAVDVKIPMLGMIKRKAEKVIVDTALKGLKTRVEG
ncbi:MAG TPA: SRPBCC family protein [Candidatus Limnocylindria bacterium]|nr:SRPBCC family protein [Candidatus Limnocylindria bacterium]